jgi:hypothetical protein
MTSINYFKLGLLLIAAVLFTNCEKDPVEPENEGNGDVKLVSRIIRYNIDDGSIDHTTDFSYDAQNRLTAIGSTNLTYPNNTTIVTDRVTFKLNSAGYVTERSDNSYDYITYFVYDGEYLARTEYSSGESIRIHNLVWENGNLISSKNDDDERLETYSYETALNKPCSIDLLWLAMSGEIYPYEWLGKSPKNRLSSYTISGAQKDNGVYHYTYGVNGEGYTTEIYIHFDDKGDASRDLQYRIEYK